MNLRKVRKVITRYPHANISNIGCFDDGEQSVTQFVESQVDLDLDLLKLKNPGAHKKALLFTKYSDAQMEFLKKHLRTSAVDVPYISLILMFFLTPFILCAKILKDVAKLFYKT